VTTLFGCSTVTATKEGAGVVLLVMMMNGAGRGVDGFDGRRRSGQKVSVF
jgi:hypothetical protein